MTTLRAYDRQNGTVGIRNHLFALPAVVCANQVAIDVARKHPELKHIEHQHGCAQIGADMIQTRQIFRELALHPNVYASMYIGLGCEGIIAKDLYAQTKSVAKKPIDLVVIQEAGGTLGAGNLIEKWVNSRQAEADMIVRTDTSWSHIVIGLLFDAPLERNADHVVAEFVEALWGLGARLIFPESQEAYLRSIVDEFPIVNYGETSMARAFVMREGSNALETSTALAAAGAHLILHFSTHPHAFGNPLVPMIRFAVQAHTFDSFPDDFDGCLHENFEASRLIEQIAQIINGKPSVAEELGLDDFALYRIGPTL